MTREERPLCETREMHVEGQRDRIFGGDNGAR